MIVNNILYQYDNVLFRLSPSRHLVYVRPGTLSPRERLGSQAQAMANIKGLAGAMILCEACSGAKRPLAHYRYTESPLMGCVSGLPLWATDGVAVTARILIF